MVEKCYRSWVGHFSNIPLPHKPSIYEIQYCTYKTIYINKIRKIHPIKAGGPCLAHYGLCQGSPCDLNGGSSPESGKWRTWTQF